MVKWWFNIFSWVQRHLNLDIGLLYQKQEKKSNSGKKNHEDPPANEHNLLQVAVCTLMHKLQLIHS